MKIIECVPNISEGRSRERVEALAGTVRRVPGLKFLDYSMDPDHHRSVFTFAGMPEDVYEGAMALCIQAVEMIDMAHHRGVHPRIGAVDVVPFVPFGAAAMADAVAVAHRFGRAFAERTGVPVFFYGEAAREEKRRELSAIRRGGYEGLGEKLRDPSWRPDEGPALFNERSGATAVGARIPLLAYNVNLETNDLQLAKTIARAIRGSCGGLPGVKSLGLYLEGPGIVQVSVNITDYRVVSLLDVYERVAAETGKVGVDIRESELVGLVPAGVLDEEMARRIRLRGGFHEEMIIENRLFPCQKRC